MKRLIFLDVDGVLNSDAWFRTDACKKEQHPHRNLDPAAVARLQKIVEKTGADIVISSSWREMMNTLGGMLRRKGLRADIIGRTADLHNRKRGQEISHWIGEHGLIGCSYVILDDDTDMLASQKVRHLVKCDPMKGLSDEDVELAIKILMPRHPFECPRCDGFGWCEGGPTIRTKCEDCCGTGIIEKP